MQTASMKADSQIKSDVLAELKWDPTVDQTEVGVQVRAGIVTLVGSIPSYAKKLAARNAAHRVFGVLDVVDNIQVKIPSMFERSDEDIAKAVRHALRWDVLVPDERITSTVSAGTVTLQGNVDTAAQRRDAQHSVERLTGVRGVINQIAVNAPPVNPEKIRHDIEEALERQSEREARNVGVEVHDGVVTLSGVVRSWGEKGAIERVVACAPGVRRVEDKTSVDPYM